MDQDGFDDVGILDQADDFHGTCTPGTEQRVHFINLLDQSSPISAALFTEFFKFGISSVCRFRLAGRMADLRADAEVVAVCLAALSPTFVAVVAVVANGLFPSVDGFDERTASMLLGQAAEYEIANVVDPRFTVVAKIRKSMLPAAR